MEQSERIDTNAMALERPGAQASWSGNVDFYEKLAGDYDLFFSDLPANMRQEGRWLDAVLSEHGVRTVLDACCGSGRQAIPLAQRGYRVTGSDPCSAMLGRARGQARAAGAAIDFFPGSFVDLDRRAPGPFDAVIAFGNGLCNQTYRADIVEALAAMRRCCRPGGLCLIGIRDFDEIARERPHLHGPRVRDVGGERTILLQLWDYDDPLLHCRAFVFRGGTLPCAVTCAETREYMLGAWEMHQVAREAGWQEVERLEHACEAVYLLK